MELLTVPPERFQSYQHPTRNVACPASKQQGHIHFAFDFILFMKSFFLSIFCPMLFNLLFLTFLSHTFFPSTYLIL